MKEMSKGDENAIKHKGKNIGKNKSNSKFIECKYCGKKYERFATMEIGDKLFCFQVDSSTTCNVTQLVSYKPSSFYITPIKAKIR